VYLSATAHATLRGLAAAAISAVGIGGLAKPSAAVPLFAALALTHAAHALAFVAEVRHVPGPIRSVAQRLRGSVGLPLAMLLTFAGGVEALEGDGVFALAGGAMSIDQSVEVVRRLRARRRGR
jgi:hypothetical protein